MESSRSFANRSASNPKRLSLELGGKSPNIAFADADLDAATTGVATGIYTGGAGQACIAGSRILVEAPIYEEFVERLRIYPVQALVGPSGAGKSSFVHAGVVPRLREQGPCSVLRVRPGITGWAQVHGRNSISWPERIELDLWYVSNRSLRVDLRVLWLTVLNLVRPRGITGAGGVNEGFPLADGGS